MKLDLFDKGKDEDIKSSYDQLESRLDSKNRALDELNERSAVIKDAYKEVEKQLREKFEVIKEKNKILDDFENELDSREMHLSKKLSKLREKEALERLKHDELLNLEDDISKKETDLQQRESVMQEKDKALAKLKEILENKEQKHKDNIDFFDKETVRLNMIIRDKKEDLKKIEKEHYHEMSALQKIQRKHDMIAEKAERQKELVNNLLIEKGKIDDYIKHHGKSIDDLRKNFDNQKEKYVHDIFHIENEVKKVKAHKDDLHNETVFKKKELENVMKKIDETNAHITQLKKEKNLLNDDITKKKEHSALLDDEITEKQEESDNKKALLDNLISEKESILARIAELKKEETRQDSVLNSLMEKIEREREEQLSLKEERGRINDEIESLKVREKDVLNLLNDKEKSLSKIEEEISERERAVDKKRADFENYARKIKIAEKNDKKYLAEIKELEARLKNRERNIDSKIKKNEKNIEKKEQYVDRKEEKLKDEQEKYERTFAELKLKIESLNNDIKESQAKYDEIFSKLKDIEKEYRKESLLLENTEKEIEKKMKILHDIKAKKLKEAARASHDYHKILSYIDRANEFIKEKDYNTLLKTYDIIRALYTDLNDQEKKMVYDLVNELRKDILEKFSDDKKK